MNTRGSTARDREVQEEITKVKLEYFTRKPDPPSFGDRLQGIFHRAGRITVGLAMTAGAIYSCSSASQKSEMPMASLTIKDLGGLVFGYGLALALVVWAFEISFEEAGKPQRPTEQWFFEEAERRIALRAQQPSDNGSLQTPSLPSKNSVWYRVGNKIGGWLAMARKGNRKSKRNS